MNRAVAMMSGVRTAGRMTTLEEFEAPFWRPASIAATLECEYGARRRHDSAHEALIERRGALVRARSRVLTAHATRRGRDPDPRGKGGSDDCGAPKKDWT